MFSMLAAFLIILGLIGLLAVALRFLQQYKNWKPNWLRANQQSIKIEEELFIDPKRKLIILSHESKRYLMVLGPHNDILLNQSMVIKENHPIELRQVGS